MSYIPSYRVLDAVPAEGRVATGARRVGLVLGLPWIALGVVCLPQLLFAGGPSAWLWSVLLVAVGAALICLCNTVGWVVSGFLGQ